MITSVSGDAKNLLEVGTDKAMQLRIHGHIESKLQTVTLQISLGLPPNVSVEMS